MNHTRFLAFWNPFEDVAGYPGAELFGGLFRRMSGIIYTDLKHNHDNRSMQILESADLAVVFLKQDYRSLDAFFAARQLRQGNILYCIYNYFEEKLPGIPAVDDITLRYQIPKNYLAAIPYNRRLDTIAGKGHLGEYLQRKDMCDPYEEWSGFFRELKQAEEKLERILIGLSEK